jgi:hypothetical protein
MEQMLYAQSFLSDFIKFYWIMLCVMSLFGAGISLCLLWLILGAIKDIKMMRLIMEAQHMKNQPYQAPPAPAKPVPEPTHREKYGYGPG